MLGKKLRTEDDRIKAAAKARKKKRKKMIKTKYGQKAVRHSKRDRKSTRLNSSHSV